MGRQREQYDIWRLDEQGVLQAVSDFAAAEEPLEIRVGGKSLSITMRTPGHDAELAAGFLAGEGVIHNRHDIAHIRPCDKDGSSMIEVLLSPTVTFDVARLTRHVFASSSCGICGSATIDAVRHQWPSPPIRQPAQSPVAIQTILGLTQTLREAQKTFDATGGLHAAGLFVPRGTLLVAREDVGRHNAVDKVLGHALLNELLPPREDLILLVTGRVSFEIIQKALAAGVSIVAAVSAPSSLAIDLATESGITLIGFLRPGKFNVYSHPQRLGN